LWQSVLLEKETRVPRENHRSVASNWQTYANSMLNNKVCNLFFVFFLSQCVPFWNVQNQV
jgi:hypothetical protein